MIDEVGAEESDAAGSGSAGGPSHIEGPPRVVGLGHLNRSSRPTTATGDASAARCLRSRPAQSGLPGELCEPLQPCRPGRASNHYSPRSPVRRRVTFIGLGKVSKALRIAHRHVATLVDDLGRVDRATSAHRNSDPNGSGDPLPGTPVARS